MNCILEARGIWKVFRTNGDKVEALKGIDLSIKRGDTVGVVGVSGSGKSTLLHILGTLDRPTEGRLIYWNKSEIQDDDGKGAQAMEIDVFQYADGVFVAPQGVLTSP